MDIIEGITEEIAMNGNLKMTDKIRGGSTTESDSTESSKIKRRCESSMGKVDPKNVKTTVPSSERDGSSLSSMSKHSHNTDSVPGEKGEKNTWTSIQR